MPHIHAQIDFTVEVFVVCRNKVLLRLHDKYHIWLSVGGHIELNEDPNQAALREVKEEVGLDVTLLAGGSAAQSDALQKELEDGYHELIVPRFLNRHRVSETHEHIALTYFATATTDQVQAGGLDCSQSWRWLTRAEVEADSALKPHIQHYALAALDAAEHGL